ncbi:O-sialoglycoprotein endopeptidase, partial [Candidatus Geothermarchaeota archaeon]
MGIESTAHTFGVAIINEDFKILADERAVLKVEPGSGIHPQKAAEHHAEKASKVIIKALKGAKVSMEQITGIAYSAGPGLGPALRIGATSARALAFYFKKPIYPVHHAIGHIELAIKLTQAKNPLVVLVSGGHTAITAFNDGKWRVYGETLDISLGNLIDQFARELNLPFPGGPA